MFGPLLEAGTSIFGSILGAKSASKNRKLASQQFDAQMDQTIQRRTADAKKAGLHPLFALGTSAGVSPTAHISGQSGSGSFLGEGIASAGRAIGKSIGQKDIQAAQLREIGSSTERNEAEAQYLRSKAKTAEGQANTGGVRTFAAQEPSLFSGTPINVPSAVGNLSFPKQHNIEELEKYIGEAADLFGIANLLKSIDNNRRQRINYRSKVRQHKHKGKIPRYQSPGWRRFKEK